nr:unnamed protein product [Callosobruchus analis]
MSYLFLSTFTKDDFPTLGTPMIMILKSSSSDLLNRSDLPINSCASGKMEATPWQQRNAACDAACRDNLTFAGKILNT